jgi:hypothetical protein
VTGPEQPAWRAPELVDDLQVHAGHCAPGAGAAANELHLHLDAVDVLDRVGAGNE